MLIIIPQFSRTRTLASLKPPHHYRARDAVESIPDLSHLSRPLKNAKLIGGPLFWRGFEVMAPALSKAAGRGGAAALLENDIQRSRIRNALSPQIRS